MLLKEIVGKPVVGIEEGKSLATVKKLLVNRKNRILEYILLNLHSVRDKEVTFVIPFADLEGIGDYAVMVRSREMIQRLDEEDIYSPFYKELTELIGELVISERGNRLGKVTDLLIDEKQGKVLEIGVTDEATSNQFNFSAQDILTFGYDVVIVNDASSAKMAPRRNVMEERVFSDRARISFEQAPEVFSEERFEEVSVKKVQDLHVETQPEVVQWEDEVKGSELFAIKEEVDETPVFENREEVGEVPNFAKYEEQTGVADNVPVQQELELASFEFKNEEEETVLSDSEHLFEEDKDVFELEPTSLGELSSDVGEDAFAVVEEENYLLDDQEVLFADQDLSGGQDSLFMEDDFLELNHRKQPTEEIGEDMPSEFFKDKSEKEFAFAHSEKEENRHLFEKKEETPQEPKVERKDNISSFDEYKKSLVKQFIDRQREVLVGKRVTEDILGKDGSILIEKGNVITMDLFNRANDDRKDSIVEMAMYSE
ncbi:MAG: PRC-barrel domain-containing protein [Filifactor alocis]|nr:PRC-barrel domain-containing protein [Filifactor alocis]